MKKEQWTKLLRKNKLLEESTYAKNKKYRGIVASLKELGADNNQIEYILSIVDSLETEAWRKGAREGFRR
jgi:hypothetical protein